MRIPLPIGAEQHLERAFQLHEGESALRATRASSRTMGSARSSTRAAGGTGAVSRTSRLPGAGVGGAWESGRCATACSRDDASRRRGQGLCPAI